MIFNDTEKKRLVDNLTWMITDMKYKSDAEKCNFEEGSEGGYSSHLQAAISLLADIQKTETIETTGCHKKAMSVNCREFKCPSNRQGICALTRVTLESLGTSVVGMLKCVQAEEVEKKKEVPCCDSPAKDKCDQCQEIGIANPNNH